MKKPLFGAVFFAYIKKKHYLCTMIQAIRDIAAQLGTAYDADEARALARWVVEETSEPEEAARAIERLLRHEPVQYVFGHALWNGLDLKVTPATLIPRPETAELVERVGKWRPSPVPFLKDGVVRVLDIGTGSGCIAIAIKKKHPEWEVTGIDISAEAVEVARENAARNGVEVAFEVADIFSPLSSFYFLLSTFDLVVSNPPYICESEKSSMKSNVLDYEPCTALFVPDDDPMRFYRRIAELRIGRFLFFEINEVYGAEVAQTMRNAGYTDIQIIQDMYGKDRIVECRMAE